MEHIVGQDCWTLYDMTCNTLGNDEIAFMLSSYLSADEMEDFIGWIWGQYDLVFDAERGCIATSDGIC